MNEKFQRLRSETLATFGLEDAAAGIGDLPAIAAAGLDATALQDLQVRLYHLWERLKHFRPDDLDDAQVGERDALAAHVERCLAMLHAPR